MPARSVLTYGGWVLAGLVLGFVISSQRPEVAVAQIPDQGAQLLKLIDESKALNAKMDRLLSLLESGKLTVQVSEPADKAAK